MLRQKISFAFLLLLLLLFVLLLLYLFLLLPILDLLLLLLLALLSFLLCFLIFPYFLVLPLLLQRRIALNRLQIARNSLLLRLPQYLLLVYRNLNPNILALRLGQINKKLLNLI